MESKVLAVALELVVPVVLVELVVMLQSHWADVAEAEVQVELVVVLQSHLAVAEEDLAVVLVLLDVPVVLVDVVADQVEAVPTQVSESKLDWVSVWVDVADQVDTGTQSWTIVESRSSSSHDPEHS